MSELALKGPDRSSVESFILSFCADYKAWNDATFALRDTTESYAADTTYRLFLRPFIIPATEVQLATYGSTATFDPERVRIQSISKAGDGAEVAFAVRSLVGDWSNEFVAELALKPTIMLKQIFYIDPYPDNGIDRLPYL